MLVTSGLLYAIVPSGATLALRVLSSLEKSSTGELLFTFIAPLGAIAEKGPDVINIR